MAAEVRRHEGKTLDELKGCVQAGGRAALPNNSVPFDWQGAAVMASARSVGTAAFKMQLRGRKRDFAASAAVTTTSTPSRADNQKKRTVKHKATSLRTKSAGQKVEIVAPSSSKSPVLTALKERLSEASNGPKILLEYPKLVPARLIRRYKRFLADVVLLGEAAKDHSPKALVVAEEEEEVVTVYCPNTGPMVGLLDGLPNARVQLSKSDDPKRKYAYTLEMIQIHVRCERDVWVGVHSTSANRMVEQALASRWLSQLGDYDSVRREVKFAKNSRVDFVLSWNAEDGNVSHEKYVEVKSVTLAVDGSEPGSSRCAVFPDTVSTRAQKHVIELTELLSTTATSDKTKKGTKGEGDTKGAAPKLSGAIIFLVQRDDCTEFAPSIQHDEKFAELCAKATKSGIQLLAYSCVLKPNEANSNGIVRLLEQLPLQKAAS
ncbi:unnamed protein product [Phytophthora fragariaefolia]|uniref:Unnamed protein product n=1 Tax=Phytophthora fragariaefolia TaxID=1490495 RepID=A0A9W7D5U2_9STRA|nr:unnamed protein product [Phytophthora fragariaefolia]